MARSRHRILMFVVFIPLLFGVGCAPSGYDQAEIEPAAEDLEENDDSFVPYLEIKFDVYNWTTTPWVEDLRREIADLWNMPNDYLASTLPGYTVVTFSVTPGGTLDDIRLQERFGQEELHTEALRCIESLMSPRPLSEGFREKQLQVEVRFIYQSSEPDIRY